MNICFECIPCSIDNYLRLINSGLIPENVQETILRRLLKFFSEVSYNQSPPALGKKLHQILREVLNNPDPYNHIKEKYNRMMLDKYAEFSKIVEDSDDPFDTAMRLSIAGNVIDFGSHHRLDVMDTIGRVLKADLGVDDSTALKEELEAADNILYIGDNAGEIVLDRIFLEVINQPNITFAVRGKPVINDATIEDAAFTGVDKCAKIVTTGDDTPGVILDTSSPEFRKVFEEADVIIAKGQGNFEGLSDVQQNIYYLLVTKCRLVAEHVGVNEKDFVVLGKNHTGIHCLN